MIEHGAQHPFDLELRIDHGGQLADGVDQGGEPLQRVIFALHGHQHGVGGGHGVHGQHVERGRAVDEDVVVFVPHRGQRIAQADLAGEKLHQTDFGRGHVGVGGDQVIAPGGFGDDHFADGGILDQQLIGGALDVILVDTAAHGGIALRIQIDHQHLAPGGGHGGGQIHTGGGFTHSTLLVGYGNDFSHTIP